MNWIRSYLSLWLMRRPKFMVAYFGYLKRSSYLGKKARGKLILSVDDAREVLGKGADFDVAPTSAPKMLAGDFIHGMDPYPRYELDRSELDGILNNEDNLRRLRKIVRGNCARVLDTMKARKGDEINIFDVFIQPVVTDSIREYYGIEGNLSGNFIKLDAGKGLWARFRRGGGKNTTCPVSHHDSLVFANALRLVGSLIALPHPAPWGRWLFTKKFYDGEFRELVDNEIRQKIGGNPDGSAVGTGDVIAQLIRLEKPRSKAADGMDMVEPVRKRLVGILATSTAINKIFVNAMEELLSRTEKYLPGNRSHMDVFMEIIDRAQQKAVDDVDRNPRYPDLRGYILEALRFNIAFPMLPRHCPRETTIGSLRDEKKTIPADTTIVNVLPAIMFDESSWPRSGTFNPEHPPDQYMHFGAGQHHCLGQEMSLAVLEEMFIALFGRFRFQELEDRNKAKQFDGPTYNAYRVRWAE